MIKQLLSLFFFLLFFFGNASGQLNANFSTNPLYNNSSNELNICAGSSVLFTFISTGSNISSATNVNWTFTTNSGTALSQTTSTLRTPFPLTFPNGTYTVTLTLSEPSGAFSTKTITINATTPPPLNPSLTLSSFSANAGWNSTTIEGVPAFSICPVNLNLSQDVTFDITPSLNCSQVTSITHTDVTATTIDCNNGYIDISYDPNSARFYYSVFSVQFTSCTFSRVYYVQIGTPSISITSASSTACDPGTYSLAFTDQTPGVTYQIDWDFNGTSFNSQSVYAYPNLPINPQKVSHSYPFTPCVNGVVQPKEINIRASNTSCPGFSESSPSQVYVSQAPEASFTRNPDVDVICQGTQVTYTDNSNPGVFVTNPGSCNTTYHRWWTHSPVAFGPGTTNTANVSNLGASSNSNPGPAAFTVTYNEPGTYTIRLFVKNNSCANDTMIKTVCVVPAVQANFNASITTDCAPAAVTTTNNSSLPGCPGTNMLYNWSVSNAAATCGTPAWNYTNNTYSNSAQPQFNFTGPGIYTIRLISSLNPSVAGAQCQNDTITQTITVKGPPIIDLPPPSPICQGQAFIPQATVNDCYTTSSNYTWAFSSGSPSSSSILNPGSITYSNYGNFTYSLSATNECGSDTENNTITVNQAAVVVANANSISCSGQAIPLSGSITGGATGGVWASSAGGTFLPNSAALNGSFLPSSGTTGTITLTLTATGVIAPCTADFDEVTITLNANPFVLAGNDTSICAGSAISLLGSIGGAATSATWSTTGSGTFQSVSSLNTIYTPSVADIAAGNVSLILTSNDPSGPCGPAKDTLNVVILPIPSLTAGATTEVCSGVNFSIPLTPSITTSPASYSWILSGTLPVGVTTASSGTISAPNSNFIGTVQNLSSGPVTVEYLITASVNGCNSTSTPVSVVINPLPQPLITPPGPITACNGSIVTLTTSVFSSFLWSTNATSQSISVNTAGNYTVTVTNSYGCVGTSLATVVNFSEPLTPTFNQVTPICYNGSFSLPSTSINGISGTWSPTINPLNTATYTFTPSPGQCADTIQMTVVVNPLPSPTISANGPLTFCDGSSVLLSASGGSSYIWNLNGVAIPGATSTTYTPTVTGNYSVTATNANGCSESSIATPVTINPNPEPTIIPNGPINLCEGSSITISTSPNYSTYNWFFNGGNSTLGDNDSLSISISGSYTVSVTNSNGCSGTSTPFVFQTSQPILPSFSAIAPICSGDTFNLQNTSTNGITGFWSPSPNYTSTTLYTFTPLSGSCALPTTVTVVVNPQPIITANGSTICSGNSVSVNAIPSPTGGIFAWSNGSTTQSINLSPITSTTYTVTYDLNGCIATDTAQITVVQSPTVSIPAVTICEGQSATLNPTVNPIGGSYLWNNNQTTSAIDVTPSTNTTYNLTYAVNGCQSIATNVLVTVSPLPTATLSPGSICAGQNTILTPIVSPSGGTYLWSTNQTTPSITINPTSSTNYTLVYTYNGCSSDTASTTISVTPLPTITVPYATICSGQSTTLNSTVNIPGGSYTWSPNTALSSSTIANPIANPNNTQQYTVTYTANGCTSLPDTVIVSVIQNIQATVNNATICNGASATLTANPANASYLWSNGSTSQTITVSPTNTELYSVIVSAAGCPSSTDTATVTVNPIPSVTVANVNAICNGSSATLTATPSAPGGTYSWSNAASGTAINVTPALTNPTLAQNFDYSVVYTLNGCPSIADTVTVAVNPVPTVSLPTTTTICNGSGDTLVATVNLTGGTYLWTNGATTPQIIVNPTSNTNYSVTYTLNGCSATSATTTGNVVVNSIPTVSIPTPPSICDGQQATLTATPSAPGGTYLWSNGATSASINVSPTTTTTYNVVYTLNGCASTPTSVTVTVNPIPTLNVPDTTICGGLSVALTANPTPTGGTYLWSANANNATTNQVTVTPTLTTTYSVAYTANGCTANDNVTVTVIQNPIATLLDTTICFGGTATLVAGPNGANYSWDTGATTQTLTVSPTVTSTYTVTVNIGGCAATSATATVTVNPIPSVTVANVNAICNGSSATLTATPSAPGGTYSWSNAASGAAINVTPALTNPTLAQNFNYSVVYTLNGCPSIADTVTVAVNPVPTVSFNDTTICSGNSTSLIGISNLLGGNYLWNTGATTQQINVSPSITSAYTLIYNLNGCNDTITDSVYVNPVPSVQINQNPTICYGETTTLTSSVSPANGTYLWSGFGLSGVNNQNQISISPQNGNSSQNMTHPYELVYTVNGCSDTAYTNINVNLIPSVIGATSEDTICPGQSIQLTGTGTPTISNGNTGTYIWYATNPIDTIGTSSIITVNPTTNTTYEVVYTVNGCESPAFPISIVIQNAPQITIQNNPNNTICEGGCVTLSAVPSSSTIVPSGYSWSTGETTQSIVVCPTDTTAYTVIGLSGTCQSPVATTIVNVTSDPIFTTAIISDTTICVGGSFTFNINTSGGVGTPTYQWYLNNIPNNASGDSIPNTNNSSYSTPTFIQATTQYYYTTISYPGVGCDQLTSPIAELNVINDPVVTINPLFNQTLCEGGIAECIVPEVYGGIGNTTYLWMPTMTADSIYCPSTNQIGTQNYNVLVQQSGIGCGSLPSNSVAITVVPDPTIQIVGISEVCFGAEVPLITSVQGGIGSVDNYQWSSSYPNGNPYTDISGANSFNYTTIALENQIGIVVNMVQTGVGCDASDTIEINVFPDPLVSIVGDSMTCIGLTNNLQALVTGGVPNSTNTFTWFNTGSLLNPTPLIVQAASQLNQYTSTIFSDTSFYVVVDNSGLGCDNDTSTLFDIEAIEWAIAGFDIEPENASQSAINPTFSFINTSQNATNYFWDLGECNPQLPISELFYTPTPSYNPTSVNQINYTYGCTPGFYAVTLYAFNQGMCPDTITELIRIRDEVIIYVPNAFTPGDKNSTNDTFYPVITGKILPKSYIFEIYNRWGELIFMSRDQNEVWKGDYRGNICQDGVYTWKLTIIPEETKVEQIKVGHVILLGDNQQ